MADPTPEMVAVSKRLSLKLWPGEDGEYPMERRIAEEAALAAIIATSDMAAKFIAMREATEGRNWQQGSKALRAFDHIKPENG